MATLSQLEGRDLHRYDPELPPGALEERSIYVTAQFRADVDKWLPGLEPAWTSEIKPIEQLAALLDDFCAGFELEHGTGFHILRPADGGVWELKSPDLRVFGWFYRRDCLIAHRMLPKDHITKHRLYGALRNDVAAFRDQLDLDAPKHIPGNDPHDVLSNYHFP